MTPPTENDALLRDPIREMEAILVRQIEAARRGDTMTVLELGRQFGAILAGKQEAPDGASYTRVQQLHAELRLIVAQQAAEVAAKRERLGRGRAPLRAYRAARPRGR